MSDHSEEFFYLIDHEGNRRVPTLIVAKDGRYGYALHPKGKGNDASAAEYTTDPKRLVQAVVLEGLGVRCRARGGPHDGQQNTLSLTGRVIGGYWLAPQYHEWVKAAKVSPEKNQAKAKATSQSPRPVPYSKPTATKATRTTPVSNDSYRNQQKFQFSNHCCLGASQELDAGSFTLDDLTITEEGNRRLRFSPLGNCPEHPRVALVGITPGGQIERFARNLGSMDVRSAARNAAFYGAQTVIKELLSAHGLANRMGIALEGDLNENPNIFTTSIVKCCLMVDDGYRFSAPDIAASPSATHCATRRFLDELLSYPTLEWVVVFGEPGWNALLELRRDGRKLVEILNDAGLKVLQLPHFAQNFQQRRLFALSPSEEARLLSQKPDFEKYAPAARRMRDAVLRIVAN